MGCPPFVLRGRCSSPGRVGGEEGAPTPHPFLKNTFITFMKHSKCPPRPTLIPLGNNSSCLLSDEEECSARDVRVDGRWGRSLGSKTQVGSCGGAGEGCVARVVSLGGPSHPGGISL